MYLKTQKMYLDTQVDTKFEMYLRLRSRNTKYSCIQCLDIGQLWNLANILC